MPTVTADLLARLTPCPPSRRGEIFPYREVHNLGPVRAIGEPSMPFTALPAVPWFDRDVSTADFLAETKTNALLIVRDGGLTTEWYAEGVAPEQRHSSWSVAKSVVSVLVGRAVQEGLVDVEARVVDILPGTRTGGEFDDVTILHLLNMSSSIDVPEIVVDGDPESGTAGLYYTADAPAYLARFRIVTAPPGKIGSYRSVDTAYLGLVLQHVTGRSLSDLASAWIWQPIGAESSARWNLDRDDGIEKAYCCFNATARDFARFGCLMAESGEVDGRPVVPAAWVERISAQPAMPLGGMQYSTHWWHLPGEQGDYSAIGIYGQYIYVNPSQRTTIVKLSDYGAEQNEPETLLALRHLATHM